MSKSSFCQKQKMEKYRKFGRKFLIFGMQYWLETIQNVLNYFQNAKNSLCNHKWPWKNHGVPFNFDYLGSLSNNHFSNLVESIKYFNSLIGIVLSLLLTVCVTCQPCVSFNGILKLCSFKMISKFQSFFNWDI